MSNKNDHHLISIAVSYFPYVFFSASCDGLGSGWGEFDYCGGTRLHLHVFSLPSGLSHLWRGREWKDPDMENRLVDRM